MLDLAAEEVGDGRARRSRPATSRCCPKNSRCRRSTDRRLSRGLRARGHIPRKEWAMWARLFTKAASTSPTSETLHQRRHSFGGFGNFVRVNSNRFELEPHCPSHRAPCMPFGATSVPLSTNSHERQDFASNPPPTRRSPEVGVATARAAPRPSHRDDLPQACAATSCALTRTRFCSRCTEPSST